MWKRYICKQLPLPNRFTEILLVKYDQCVEAGSVLNRNFFSNTLKALGQTYLAFFFLIICKKCKAVVLKVVDVDPQG